MGKSDLKRAMESEERRRLKRERIRSRLPAPPPVDETPRVVEGMKVLFTARDTMLKHVARTVVNEGMVRRWREKTGR